MFAIAVIGPPGSGKTSVLTALHDLLAADDVGHAAIEVEAVAWAHPPLADERSFRHLSYIRDGYAQAGYRLILVGATVTSAAYLTALLAAVAPDERLVVRLEAPPRLLRERLVDREPPEWSGLPGLLRAADEIAVLGRALDGVDLVCSTESTSPLAVAERIRAALQTHHPAVSRPGGA